MMRPVLSAVLLLALSACGTGLGAEQSAHDMLLAGDPAACAAAGVVDGAIGAISEEYRAALEEGMPSFPAAQVTATAIDKDINEVSCQAKITNLNFILVKGAILKFTLRPSLDDPGQVSVDVKYDTWVPFAIEAQVSDWRKSERMEYASSDATTATREPSDSNSFSALALQFGNGFESYPVDIYQGPAAPLRLSQGQKTFVTRIKEAYQESANFGGSLVILQFGCGTGCTFAYALDKSSGLVLDFPVGGEEYQYLTISTRVDSALVWAGWQSSYDPKECRGQAWVLGKLGFEERVKETTIDCEAIDV